ncbi:MAG: hypothetical protein R3219_07940 [Hydrogenovibrio sp.]|nr:hypothetical protein [Hydrogenovibrio sp.]
MQKKLHKKAIEPYYMNALPFSARDAASRLFRDYRIDQLVQMRLHRVDDNLEKDHALSADTWRMVLNHVILTKLTTLTIHTQLSQAQLNRLVEIAAFALDEPSASISRLIVKTESIAPVLSHWLQVVQLHLKD